MNKPIDLYIITITAMHREAVEMVDESYHNPGISQSMYIGKKHAFEQVLRYLKNMKEMEEGQNVSLAESLAKMRKD